MVPADHVQYVHPASALLLYDWFSADFGLALHPPDRVLVMLPPTYEEAMQPPAIAQSQVYGQTKDMHVSPVWISSCCMLSIFTWHMYPLLFQSISQLPPPYSESAHNDATEASTAIGGAATGEEHSTLASLAC